MGKKLAIKGHPTRGKEVVELLEMLGGVAAATKGFRESYCYYISEDTATKYISWDYIGPEEIEKYKIFTLEEFLEKYPFKIGDKVIDINCPDEIGEVFELYWDDSINDMLYRVQFKADDYWYAVDDIKLFERKYEFDGRIKNENDECSVILNQLEKELDKAFEQETSEEYFSNEPEPQPNAPILSNRYDYADGKCGYVIPDGYEFDCIKEGFQTEIILKPKKPTYPKTYKECCDVLGIDTMDNDAQGYKADLIIRFQELIIARDAYWKIAGDELGLSKPWEPDFTNNDEERYGIYTLANKVERDFCGVGDVNMILSFPTEEMRDVFCDNFKKEIEQCKELL